jgi:hypothetical protein
MDIFCKIETPCYPPSDRRLQAARLRLILNSPLIFLYVSIAQQINKKILLKRYSLQKESKQTQVDKTSAMKNIIRSYNHRHFPILFEISFYSCSTTPH